MSKADELENAKALDSEFREEEVMREEVADAVVNHHAQEMAINDANTKILFDLVPVLDTEQAQNTMMRVLKTGRVNANLKDVREGNTLLIYGAEYQFYDMVYYLIHGLKCDVNVANKHGCTALHFACSAYKDIRIVTLLLANGCLDSVEYDHGCTALHYAAGIDAPELIEVCLRYHCSPSCPNKEGFYPIDYAKAAKLEKNVKLLEEGRKPQPPPKMMKHAHAALLAAATNAFEFEFKYDWVEYQADGYVYYYQKSTKTSQWHRPHLPKGYIQNRIHNCSEDEEKPPKPEGQPDEEATKVRMRKPPPGHKIRDWGNKDKVEWDEEKLSTAWERLTDEDGNYYYFHKETKEVQWEVPRGLEKHAIQVQYAKGTSDRKAADIAAESDLLKDEGIVDAESAARAAVRYAQKFHDLQTRCKELEAENKRLKDGGEAGTGSPATGGTSSTESDAKIKELETKMTEMQKDFEAKLAAVQSGGGGAAAPSGNATVDDLTKQLNEAKAETNQKVKEALTGAALKTADVAKAVSDGDKKELMSKIDFLQHELDNKTEEVKKMKLLTEDAAKARDLAVEESIKRCHTSELANLMGQKLLTKIGKDKADKAMAKLMEDYTKESKMRRKIYNELEDLKGNIRVFARVRPQSKNEKERGAKMAVEITDDYSLSIMNKKKKKQYTFDRIFGPDSTQEQVFADTKRLVQSAVDGFNVCIFAYGQTGAGKSFTMIGAEGEGVDESLKGLTPRTIDEIWDLKAAGGDAYTIDVEMSLYEIYQDTLEDLLRDDPKKNEKLVVKLTKKGNVQIEGGKQVKVPDKSKLYEYWNLAMKRRHVASHNLNAVSSRSHLIQQIYINTSRAKGKKTLGKLTLVDLAGSERQERTGATGERAKEGININKSLSALGNVINSLTTKQKHTPYRDSDCRYIVLTMLMRDSLGGNSKTLMFVNLSPADDNASESVGSLNFAERCKKVENNAQPGVSTKEVEKLKEEIEMLKAKLQTGGDIAD
eukprot:g2044.t1